MTKKRASTNSTKSYRQPPPHIPTDQTSARAPTTHISYVVLRASEPTEDCDCFFQFISVTLNAQQTRHTRRRRCLHLPQQRRNQIKIKLSGFHCKQISLHLIITDAVAVRALNANKCRKAETAGGESEKSAKRRGKKEHCVGVAQLGKVQIHQKKRCCLVAARQPGRQLLTLTLALPLSLFLWSHTHLHGTRAISISYITVWRSLPRDPFTTHQFACTHTRSHMHHNAHACACVCVCVSICVYTNSNFDAASCLKLPHLYHLFMYISVPALTHKHSRTDICLSVSTVCMYICLYVVEF